MTRNEHLLDIIGEEGSEVHQRCSKALRFGADEIEPGQHLDNGMRILHEFNDMVAVLEMYFGAKIHNFIHQDLLDAKKAKVEKYLLYSKQRGTLTE